MIKAIAKLFSIDELFQTIKRFPLSVACTVGLALIFLSEIHDAHIFDDGSMGRLCALFSSGFLWFGAVRLIAESQSLSMKKESVIGLSFFLLGVLCLFVFDTAQWYLHLWFIYPALILFVMISPFLKSGDDWSVWVFNRSLYLSVFLAIIVGVIFGGGISAALFAIKTLFGVDISYKVWGDVWVFASCILGPIYGLTNVPKHFEHDEDIRHIPPGFPFIANWISVPIIFGYFAILYAYFIKIILVGELPNGYLVYLITGFVGAGLATYMLAYPLRESGRLQVRLFYRYLFPALIIPVGFHFIAIWERVSAYGITEQRYVIILSALWFALLAISGAISKGRIPLKVLPFSLCILLAFASIGPWGGVKVAEYSQVNRLERLLSEYDLLTDGEITKASDGLTIPVEDRRNISSIINYLCNSYRYEPLEKWFDIEEDEKEWRERDGVTNKVKLCLNRNNFKDELGFAYNNSSYYDRGDTERFSTYFTDKDPRDIRGFDLYLKNQYANFSDDKKRNRCLKPIDEDVLCFSMSQENILSVYHGESVLVTQDITKVIIPYIDGGRNEDRVLIELDNPKITARLFVNNMNGAIQATDPKLEYINFDMAYSLKD